MLTGALASAAALASCGRRSAPTDDLGFGGEPVVPPLRKPNAVLESSNHRPFDFIQDTRNRLTLVFFGYTHCPDVCPVTLNVLSLARRKIGSGPGSRPLVLFVSVDPNRDTPGVLRDCLDRIDDTFVGLTAPASVTDRMVRELHLPPTVIQRRPATGDVVMHAAQVLVFGPDGLSHRTYPSGTRAQVWAHDLPRLDRPPTRR